MQTCSSTASFLSIPNQHFVTPPRNPSKSNGPTKEGGGTAQAPAGLQTTPASSLCKQSCPPQPPCGHSVTVLSVPSQFTLASHIGPRPLPNAPPSRAVPPEYPSDWHTTKASGSSQPSSQTVPHTPLCRTSTRPDRSSGPPTRRVSAAQKKQTRIHTPTSVWSTAQATGVCLGVDHKSDCLKR